MREPASGSRGARHPHILNVHSGACAPGSPDVGSLATISVAMYSGCLGGYFWSSIHLCRHSGAGRNPAQLFNMQLGFVRYADSLFQLDSGLRRNDDVTNFCCIHSERKMPNKKWFSFKQQPLRWEILATLSLKIFLLFILWWAFFSHAPDKQSIANAVAERISGTAPDSSSTSRSIRHD
ncbi:MAG: hypothetical protein PHQ60_12310 [Sideroxydans sp.]|nr:hypothetical protein [Sideroxydans sp.]